MAPSTESARALIEAAFTRFEKSVSSEDARAFKSTTLQDVRLAAISIQKEQRQRGLLQNMKRIEPLLKGIEIYSKPLDVLCNGTPFLSWVWVRTLMTATIISTYIGSRPRSS